MQLTRLLTRLRQVLALHWLRPLAFVLAAFAFPGWPISAAELRVATFNVSLFGAKPGEVLQRLESGDDPQARRLAEIIQRAAPDVILLNEFDYDAEGKLLALFCDKYLAVPQNISGSPTGPAKPLDFPHRFWAPSNTGEPSGFDLDHNGRVSATPGDRNYGGDCWGFGVYPGQYAFALLSKFPIDRAHIRQFKNYLWRDLPGAQLPDDPKTEAKSDWYSPEVLARFPLSSKNHCDVPVTVAGRTIHFLISHPTPPIFDGPEDRNGLRNRDELRFWSLYVTPDSSFGPLPSAERSREGGVAAANIEPSASPSPLAPSASFVILGDLNGDPHDGDGPAGITELLASPRILKYPAPRSAGGAEQARRQGGANARHRGDPANDTCDPGDDPGPGNLHLDYVLPSNDFQVTNSAVFWPATTDPLFPLVAGAAEPASSDHRLVWADLHW